MNHTSLGMPMANLCKLERRDWKLWRYDQAPKRNLESRLATPLGSVQQPGLPVQVKALGLTQAWLAREAASAPAEPFS